MSEKAFGYVRVSGHSQVEGDGPVRQKIAIGTFAKAAGLEVAEYFQDLAVSGTVDGLERPEFSRLVAACEATGCRTIIVEKIERFARDLMVSEVLFAELRKRNIKLLACDQGTDDLAASQNDPTRTMIRQLFGALAQYEKSSLVLKLKVARERAYAAGGKRGCNPAYGSTSTKRSVEEKRILELIAALREAGATWHTVAFSLTQAGFSKRSGSTVWKRQDAWELFQRFVARQKQLAKKDEQNEHSLQVSNSTGITPDGRSGDGSGQAPG